jgi:hypothetical protein
MERLDQVEGLLTAKPVSTEHVESPCPRRRAHPIRRFRRGGKDACLLSLESPPHPRPLEASARRWISPDPRSPSRERPSPVFVVRGLPSREARSRKRREHARRGQGGCRLLCRQHSRTGRRMPPATTACWRTEPHLLRGSRQPEILVSPALPRATILATQLGCTQANEAYADALAGHRN